MKPADGPVPRLRFPEFRDAGPWEMKRLGEVCEINPPSGELPESFIYIDLESVSAGELLQKKVVSRNEAPSRAQRRLSPGDIIYQMVRPYQRNNLLFAIVGDMKYVASTGYAQLRAKSSAEFLFQLVHTDSFVGSVLQKCTGSNYPAINPSDLGEIHVSVPSNPEQHKIADCLTSLDELIRAEGEVLAALRDHKRGLMQRLFPRPGETTPRLRFPEFRDAGPWEVRIIADLAERIAQGGTPATSVPENWNGGIPWITPAEMGDDADHHYTTSTVRTLSWEGLATSSAELLPPHSVIISSRAPIGYVTINLVEMATNQGCKGIVPRSGFSHEFLYFSLLNSKSRLNDVGAGAGFKEISVSSLAAFPIPVPSLPEQHKIADCLTSLDELIRAEGERLAALKAHKRGLMQQLFPQGIA